MTTATQRINLAERLPGPGRYDQSAWEILEVIDTRQRGQDRKPESGTGEQVPCQCCGRMIEVHAMASHRITGELAIVGTGCADKAKLENTDGFVKCGNKAWWRWKKSF